MPRIVPRVFHCHTAPAPRMSLYFGASARTRTRRRSMRPRTKPRRMFRNRSHSHYDMAILKSSQEDGTSDKIDRKRRFKTVENYQSWRVRDPASHVPIRCAAIAAPICSSRSEPRILGTPKKSKGTELQSRNAACENHWTKGREVKEPPARKRQAPARVDGMERVAAGCSTGTRICRKRKARAP